MIQRFTAFRWWWVTVLIATIAIITFQKTDNIRESRFLPPIFTNFYFNCANQSIRESKVDERVVFVNARYTDDDSLLASLISKISDLKPRVIAIDYVLYDSSLIGRFTVDPNVAIIFATPRDERDSLEYSINPFTRAVHYGHVTTEKGSIFISDKQDTLSPLSVIAVRNYDEKYYRTFRDRENSFEFINYSHPDYIRQVFGEDIQDGNVMGEVMQDKIVLIGWAGLFGTPEPTQADNIDVHETPIGEQFGSIILVNEIMTLLGNFTTRPSLVIEYIFIILISGISSFLIFGLSHWNKKALYIFSKAYMLILWFCTLMVGLWLFHNHQIFVDYQSFCLTAVISTELSFWITLK
jgi:CHASE2 domain-containing sensor protein